MPLQRQFIQDLLFGNKVLDAVLTKGALTDPVKLFDRFGIGVFADRNDLDDVVFAYSDARRFDLLDDRVNMEFVFQFIHSHAFRLIVEAAVLNYYCINLLISL